MNVAAKSIASLRDGRLSPVVGAALIVLVTFIVYLPVLQAGFIWDDGISLADNPAIKSLSGLYDIWLSTKPYDYFPLTFTSFWLEWRLWGMNPMGYHAVNVLLHALGAVLLWRVLLRLIIPGAWLAAMVFAVHPACVASVAWVAERKNTLSLVFYLLSLLWYLRSEDQNFRLQVSGVRHGTPSANQTRRPSHLTRYYWLSLLAFLLALLSKTSVVMLPLVLLLCLWWRYKQNTEADASSAHLLGNLRRMAPFFAMALIFGLVTVWFQSHRAMGEGIFPRDSLAVRLLGGTWAVWFYLGKVLWPVKLSMIYPRWEIHPASVIAYVPALLWVGGIILCWRFRRTWGAAALFGLGYFFVTLLPVLGFFDMYFFAYSRVADHWQYLALIGVIALVVAGLTSRFQSFRFPFRLGAGVVVVVLSLLTRSQARVYTSQETLWRDTVAKNPRAWVAHNNLSNCVTKPEEVVNCCLAALKLNPKYADAHSNLGKALMRRGQMAEAMAHCEAALSLNPDHPAAHNNLGNVLSAQGRFGEAATHYQATLRTRPDSLEAHHNLGMALDALGRMEAAIAEFAAALKLKPDFAPTQYQLAEVFLKQGKKAEAAKWFGVAVQNQPDHAEAHYRLGVLLAEERKVSAAIHHLREGVRLKPDLVEALNHLAWIFATHPETQYRNEAEAMQLAERAVELTKQKDAGKLDTLAAACAEAGRFAEAVKMARQAMATATAAGQQELAGQIETRLKLYQSDQPWREP